MAVMKEKSVTRIDYLAASLEAAAGSDKPESGGEADKRLDAKGSEAGSMNNGSGSVGMQSGAGSPPIQTEAELQLVKRYILLGIIMQILNHDIRVIDSAGMKLPRLYESMLRAVQDRVLLDLAHTRRLFREHGIKVYEEKRQTDGLHAKYVCRGYHHHFFMLWGFIKAESERMLKQYITLST